MPDFNFKVTSVYQATRHHATRAAVMYPLFGNAYRTGMGFDVGTSKLISLWRRRLGDLKKAGWGPLNGKVSNHQYMRNCPPQGVMTEDRSYPCNQARICPHCWAREYVLPGYMFLERMLYGSTDPLDSDGAKKRPPPGIHLVSFLTRYVVDRPHYTDDQWLGAVSRSVEPKRSGNTEGPFRRYIRTHRYDETTLHAADAYVVLQRVNLEPDGRTIVLERGGMILTRKPFAEEHHRAVMEKRMEASKKSNLLYRHAESVTKAALAEGARIAFRYPRGMMYQPAKQVIQILNGLSAEPKMRLFNRSGPKSQKTFFEKVGLL